VYQRFFGIRELPFELTPNTSFLFLTPRHREALSSLEYGLSSARSITLLLGEAGTGKTTLIRAALESERCRNVRCVYLNNPALTAKDFVRTLAGRFGLGAQARESKALLLQELEMVLRERRSHGEITALVVDEAQSLSRGLLEELRLLANIETSTERLLPLVLAGQPELGTRLEEPGLRQLKQRISLRCELAPFELSDTAAYISSRLTTAGGIPSRIFTREAVRRIHEYSGGIPRVVSVICDNAMVSGMALGRQPVDQALVLEVCRDLALRPEKRHLPMDAATPVHEDNSSLASTAASAPQESSVRKPPDSIASHRRFALSPTRSFVTSVAKTNEAG
jgi:general secretion pathway protein A